ncbi:MAG: hypothetical protein H8D45_09705 [Bacteroidetes bacterium]|nr:hypothetical protein [Bacteroidota bacterium]
MVLSLDKLTLNISITIGSKQSYYLEDVNMPMKSKNLPGIYSREEIKRIIFAS